MRMTWLTFDPSDYVSAGGWRGLSGPRPTSFDALASHADSVEGDAHRLLCFDGPLWSLELVFEPDGRLAGDQLQIAPELAGLDPEADADTVRARLAFAYLADVEHAPAVAGVAIDAVYGDDPRCDESVLFLRNGVNLHYQPVSDGALLRLITNGHGLDSRALVRRLMRRRR